MHKPDSVIAQIINGTADRVSGLESVVLETERLRNTNDFICATTTSGTHYHRYGRESPNIPIVMLHPMTGNCHNWLEIVEDLRSDQVVYVIDAPYHGLSAYTLEDNLRANYVSWLEDFIRNVELPSLHLVGLSFGARVAAFFAADHPHVVASLTLFGPAIKPRFRSLTVNDSLVVRTLLNLPFRSKLLRPISWYILKSLIVSDDQSVINKLKYAHADIMADQERHSFFGLSKPIEWIHNDTGNDVDWQSLSKHVPISVYYGSADPYCRSTEGVFRDIESANTVMVEGASHLIPLERPALTIIAIRENIKSSAYFTS